MCVCERETESAKWGVCVCVCGVQHWHRTWFDMAYPSLLFGIVQAHTYRTNTSNAQGPFTQKKSSHGIAKLKSMFWIAACGRGFIAFAGDLCQCIYQTQTKKVRLPAKRLTNRRFMHMFVQGFMCVCFFYVVNFVCASPPSPVQ